MASSGWSTPVDVSPWTMATSLVGARRSSAAIGSGSSTLPQAPRTAETAAPQRSAISMSRSPKRPHSPTITRSPGSTIDVMAASSAARPVPETGNARSLPVSNAKRVSSITSFMIAVNSGSNCPSSGVDIARSTRGSAIEGPGPSRMRGSGMSSRTP